MLALLLPLPRLELQQSQLCCSLLWLPLARLPGLTTAVPHRLRGFLCHILCSGAPILPGYMPFLAYPPTFQMKNEAIPDYASYDKRTQSCSLQETQHTPRQEKTIFFYDVLCIKTYWAIFDT
jgi:hypothetical protein